MSRYACHKLIAPSPSGERTCSLMQTVELDADGCFVSCAPLYEETRQTVWLGGICVLLPEAVVPHCGESVQAVMVRAAEDMAKERLRLWRIDGLPVELSDDSPVSRWERVG